MFKYFILCKCNHLGLLKNSLETDEPTSINKINKKLNERRDISNKFWDLLQLTYKAVVLQKEEFAESSNKTVNMIENKMCKLYNIVTSSTNPKFDDIVALATCYCNVAMLYKDQESKTKLSTAQSYLNKCLILLKEKELDDRAVLIVMRAYMQMYSINCLLNNENAMVSFLQKAIGLYLRYIKGDTLRYPVVRYSVSLEIEIDKCIRCTKLCSNPLNSLIKIFSKCLENAHEINNIEYFKTCEFCIIVHNFLMNRWEIAAANPVKEGLYWVQLSQHIITYFIRNHHFTEARNIIAASQYMLNICKENLPISTDNEGIYNFPYYTLCAYTHSAWVYYGCTLLYMSQDNLSYHQNFVQEETKQTSLISEEPIDLSLYTNLGKKLKSITNQITDRSVSNLNDAKLVFVFCIQEFENAKAYYEKTERGTLYYKIICFLSRIYRYLAFFEPDKINKIKLQKRRMQMLENVFTDKCDFTSNIFQAMAFDLINTYSILIELLIEGAEINYKVLDKVESEINLFVTNILNYYELCYV